MCTSITLSHSSVIISLTVLTSNNLATFASLLPLANFSKLEHLSLIGNPVRSQKYYREWVIWKVSLFILLHDRQLTVTPSGRKGKPPYPRL